MQKNIKYFSYVLALFLHHQTKTRVKIFFLYLLFLFDSFSKYLKLFEGTVFPSLFHLTRTWNQKTSLGQKHRKPCWTKKNGVLWRKVKNGPNSITTTFKCAVVQFEHHDDIFKYFLHMLTRLLKNLLVSSTQVFNNFFVRFNILYNWSF